MVISTTQTYVCSTGECFKIFFHRSQYVYMQGTHTLSFLSIRTILLQRFGLVTY